MATVTLDAAPRYAAGSTVQVYLDDAFVNGSGPTKAPLTSSVVGSTGVLTFTGLVDDTRYLAAQLQSGSWKLTSFSTVRPAHTVDERLALLETDIVELGGFTESAANFANVDRSGSADSYAGLTAAFAAQAGKALILPFGRYKSLTGLVVPAGGLSLILDDAELDLSNLAASAVGLTCAGSIGSWVNANAVAFNATAITGAPGFEAGFAAGDIIKLRATDVYDPGRTSTTGAEQRVVLSTSSGQINLRSPVMGAYSTGVQVAKVTRSKLTIRGTGRITMGGSGSDHIGLLAKWIDALRIDGPKIEFRGCERVGVQLWDCVDFEVGHIDVEGSNNSTGYGLSTVNACQFGRVHHSHFRDCRHYTSTNNSATDGSGLPRHITFENCTGRDNVAGADGFDAHAAAEYINYVECEAHDTSNVAFNLECPKASVIGCKSFGSGSHGIYFFNCAAKSAEYVARNNQIYDVASAGWGIRYGAVAAGGSSSPTILDIEGNNLIRCGQGAVFADPSTLHRLVGAKINGNRGHTCGTSGTSATFYVLKADASQVCHNLALNQPNALIGTRLEDFTHGSYVGNITAFASGGTSKGHYGVGVVDSVVGMNNVMLANGVGCEGLELDATSGNNTLPMNALRGATNPLVLNGVTSHISTTADASGAYNKVA